MQYYNGSLTCVINGDWNKKYIQPQWLGENIFKADEIEVAMNASGSELKIAYKVNGIIIEAAQDKFVFKALDFNPATIKDFEKAIYLFLENATTPQVDSFGFNCTLFDTDMEQHAKIVDAMEDTAMLIEKGIAIETTEIYRKMKVDDKLINLRVRMENDKIQFIFNEHHDGPYVEEISSIIAVDDIEKFLLRCEDITKTLGYAITEEDSE